MNQFPIDISTLNYGIASEWNYLWNYMEQPTRLVNKYRIQLKIYISIILSNRYVQWFIIGI